MTRPYWIEKGTALRLTNGHIVTVTGYQFDRRGRVYAYAVEGTEDGEPRTWYVRRRNLLALDGQSA